MHTCPMCEAEFPNKEAFRDHVEKAHGGQRWFQSQYAAHRELAPYIPSPTESRQVIERFAKAQQGATTEPVNEPYRPRAPMERQKAVMWAELLCAIANAVAQASPDEAVRQECEEAMTLACQRQAECMDEGQNMPYVEVRG